MLAKVPRETIRGLFASVECPDGKGGSRLSFRVLQSSAEGVARVLAAAPPGSGFAIVLEPDPGADGLMVWQPDQVAPTAITPPGSAGRRFRCALS